MEWKECKIVCDGKEVAVVNRTKDGIAIRCIGEGKELCKKFGCC